MAKFGSKKVGDKDDEDDPIAKSLNERIAAGGVTQVVSKPGGRTATVSQPGLRRPVPKPRESNTEAGES